MKKQEEYRIITSTRDNKKKKEIRKKEIVPKQIKMINNKR